MHMHMQHAHAHATCTPVHVYTDTPLPHTHTHTLLQVRALDWTRRAKYRSVQAMAPLLPRGGFSLLRAWPSLLVEIFSSLRMPNYASHAKELLDELLASLAANLGGRAAGGGSDGGGSGSSGGSGGSGRSLGRGGNGTADAATEAAWRSLVLRPLLAALSAAAPPQAETIAEASLPALLQAQPAALRWLLALCSAAITPEAVTPATAAPPGVAVAAAGLATPCSEQSAAPRRQVRADAPPFVPGVAPSVPAGRAVPPLPDEAEQAGLEVWRQTDESGVRGAGGELVATETVTVVRVAHDGREVASYAGMQRHSLSGALEASRGTVGVSLSSDRQQLTLTGADGLTRLVGLASLLKGSAAQPGGSPLAAPRPASTAGAVGVVGAVGALSGAGATEDAAEGAAGFAGPAMATQQCVRLVMALLKTARGLGLLDGRGLEAAEQQLGSDAWPVRGLLLAPPSYAPTLPGYHPTRCAARSSRRHC